jgi:hypothetical protein
MAWEIEYEHVDLAEMMHEIGLIEKSVINADGEPARFVQKIALGDTEASGLHSDGRLLRAKVAGSTPTEELDPRQVIKTRMEQLNQQHARGRAYAQRHGVALRKAPRRA